MGRKRESEIRSEIEIFGKMKIYEYITIQATAFNNIDRLVGERERCLITLSYCIVLYCIVLYCIVLYCIVLYCIVLYCIVLYCIVLYCIV